MDNKQEERLLSKVRLMQQYQEIWKHPAFQDFLNYMQNEQTRLWNEVLKEQEFRQYKIPTDTLRGQAQMVIQLNDYLAKIFREGMKAGDSLAESRKTGNM